MPKGFETREVVRDSNAPTGREEQIAPLPRAPVQTPRPSSVKGGSKDLRQLADALGTARTVLDKYAEKKIDEWFVEGKMQFAEGAAESEIAADGNKFTIAGYQTMKLRSASNQWFQEALASIDSNDHQLTSEQYQDKLSQGFTGLLGLAGDDAGSRSLLTDIASDAMPKLVTQHTKAHNAFNKENSRESYKELLVSERTDPEELRVLAHPTSSLFGLNEHNEIVAEAMSIQLTSGDTALYDAVTPGAETVQDFMAHGYTEADSTTMAQAYAANNRVEAVRSQDMRTELQVGIMDDVSLTGNTPRALQAVKDAQSVSGYTDEWVEDMNVAIGVASEEYTRTQEYKQKANAAVVTQTMNQLTGNSKKFALQSMRDRAKAKASIDPRVTGAPQGDQEFVFGEVARENYITELSANPGTVDLDLKKSITDAVSPKTVLDKDGSINQLAVSSFHDYQLMQNRGGEFMAADHLAKGYTRDLFLLANLSMQGETGISENDALLHAALELDVSTVPKNLKSVKVSSPTALNAELTSKMDDLIRPGSWFGRTLGRILGNPPTSLGMFDVKTSEYTSALTDPALQAEAMRLTKVKLNSLPLGLDENVREKLAIESAVTDLASRAEYIGGSMVIGKSEDFDRSIQEASGTFGLPGALNTGYMHLMRDLGETFWGDAYNDFQFYRKPTQSGILAGATHILHEKFLPIAAGGSLYDSVRGVPSMKVQYHSSSENLIIYPYASKDRFSTIPDPMLISISDVGRAYRLRANGQEEEYQALVSILKAQLGR